MDCLCFFLNMSTHKFWFFKTDTSKDRPKRRRWWRREGCGERVCVSGGRRERVEVMLVGDEYDAADDDDHHDDLGQGNVWNGSLRTCINICICIHLHIHPSI